MTVNPQCAVCGRTQTVYIDWTRGTIHAACNHCHGGNTQ